MGGGRGALLTSNKNVLKQSGRKVGKVQLEKGKKIEK